MQASPLNRNGYAERMDIAQPTMLKLKAAGFSCIHHCNHQIYLMDRNYGNDLYALRIGGRTRHKLWIQIQRHILNKIVTPPGH
jgi:hypothetical protein